MGARQLDLGEAAVPPFRSSLGGGVLVLLHIVRRIAIVQAPDGVHQLVIVLVRRVLAFWGKEIDESGMQ